MTLVLLTLLTCTIRRLLRIQSVPARYLDAMPAGKSTCALVRQRFLTRLAVRVLATSLRCLDLCGLAEAEAPDAHQSGQRRQRFKQRGLRVGLACPKTSRPSFPETSLSNSSRLGFRRLRQLRPWSGVPAGAPLFPYSPSAPHMASGHTLGAPVASLVVCTCASPPAELQLHRVPV